jgi:thiamine pyrophosphate-dependent acetolactate synthase large subunit-like protein
VAAVSLHQGCGLTNALTGIAEAAKSRTPLVVVTAEATQRRSNFFVDQPALAQAVGAVSMRVTSAAEAARQAAEAVATAVQQRRTVLLNLPLDVQSLPAAAPMAPASVARALPLPPAAAQPEDVERLATALRTSRRPVFVAGRGARGPGCRAALEQLADRCGALLATSAVAKGLFAGNPWSLDVSGGFASPLAAELIGDADLIVGWGCALNMWTMRHGRLIAAGATVIQVDVEADALGAHRQLTFGVLGDAQEVAEAVAEELAGEGSERTGYRSAQLRARIAAEVRWRDVAYEPATEPGRIDPRDLTIALDDLLPAERIVSVDSGNFMGHPSMFLGVPDEFGFCFTQAFQSVGLGLGDGGLLMGASELETVVRLGLPMVVIVYDDEAYGAEVHHFGPDGASLDTVRFPETDLAAVARGYGFDGVLVRSGADLAGVAAWVESRRTVPLLIDAKVTRAEPSWWLEEAFQGH